MKLKNKKICITGGAGFLGSHLCRKLVSANNRVIVLDNFSTGSMDNLEGLEREIEIIKADIRDLSAIRDALSRSDIVYHLAAIANLRTCSQDLDLAFEVNVGGTKNVLSCCSNVERVVFPSSITVYGSAKYVPIDEEHPIEPLDPYSVTKLIDEYLIKMYNIQHGIPFTITRNCNAFGPNQIRDFLIPTLITQGLVEKQIEIWDPRPVRDFIFVDDVISAFIRVVESEATRNQICNLGTGRGFSAGELADIISNLLGVTWVDAKKPQAVSPKLVSNATKIRALTEWKPETSMEAGLRMTVEYWKDFLLGTGAE